MNRFRIIQFLLIAIFPIQVFANSFVNDLEKKTDSLFKLYDKPDVPGACVAVIKNGEIVFSKAYGLAELKGKTPVTDRTNFRLASVTKQFTAMCIVMLKEQGKLNYDDPITNFFSDFPEIGKKITVRHLLWHTSGLIDYENLVPEGQTTQLKDRDVLELLKKQHDTYFTPGTDYRYSNTGYALLALIIEKVSGKRYADFLDEHIFKPAGMNSSIAYEKGVSVVDNRAMGYKETGGIFADRDQSLTSAVLGDGGIYCNIKDYAAWDKALRFNTLVDSKTQKEIHTPGKLANGKSTIYGFGWRVERKHNCLVAHHNGGTSGFNTAVRRMLDKPYTIIVLTNRAGGPARENADKLLEWLLARSDI